MAISFGAQQNVGTAGPTTSSLAKGAGNLAMGLLGSLNSNASTPAFASGAGTGANVATINPGIKAKTPYGLITPAITTLPTTQVQTAPQTPAKQSTSGGTTGNGATGIASGATGGGTTGETAVAPLAGAGTQALLNSVNAPNISNGQFINDSGSGTGYNTGAAVTPSSVASLGSVVSSLAATAGTSSPQYQQAQAAYTQAYNQLQTLQTQAAQAQGSVQNTPGISLGAAAGQAGQIQNLLANEEAPLSQEMSAAQTSAGMATAQQGTQQTGLIGAANALQPQTQYGALTSPVTGQPISSSGVVSSASSLPAAAQSALAVLPTNGQNAVMLEAQKVQNNSETLAQAQTNLSAYGQTGVTALSAILGSGFNTNTNAGASAAQQSNVSTAGTASAATNAGIYQTQLTSAAGTLQQAQAIQSSGAQLINTMTSLGINPTDPNIANKTINQLSSQFSSPAYATFNANIANLQAKVSSLLSAGEIPTTASGAAQQIIDGSMSVSGLSAAITQINTEASQLAASQLSTATTAYQNLQSGNNGTTNTSAPSPYH
jgi:hypothetical protein